MLREISEKEKSLIALCSVTLENENISKIDRFKIRCYMLSMINKTYFDEKEIIDSILDIVSEGVG